MVVVKSTILIAAICVLPSCVIASEYIQVKSKIIFNTTCARCHEGECSGRLSFNLPKSAVDQHILRHGGELSLEVVQQLFELLRYMKEECGFYPLSVGLAQDHIWDRDTLDKLKSPASQAYFVPLGLLEPGIYQLQLEGIEENTDSCMEFINAEFDYFEKKKEIGINGKPGLQFQVDERSEFYFRITSKRPITLTKLKLLASEKKSTSN